jgi:hypothetical protein
VDSPRYATHDIHAAGTITRIALSLSMQYDIVVCSGTRSYRLVASVVGSVSVTFAAGDTQYISVPLWRPALPKSDSGN